MELSQEKIQTQLKKRNKRAERLISDSFKIRNLVKRFLNKIKRIRGMRPYAETLESMCRMVYDYALKEYTNVSLSTIIIIVSALIYVLSPIDLIPDIIPIVGYLDDIAIIAYVIQTLRVELVKYNVWKKEEEKRRN